MPSILGSQIEQLFAYSLLVGKDQRECISSIDITQEVVQGVNITQEVPGCWTFKTSVHTIPVFVLDLHLLLTDLP